MNKTFTDERPKLEIATLKNNGFLTSGRHTGEISFTGSLSSAPFEIYLEETRGRFVLKTAPTNNGKSEVKLSSTECNYGGKRFWFHCPQFDNQQRCESRVGTLYLDKNNQLGCRDCLNLLYRSQYKKVNKSNMLVASKRLLEINQEIEELEKGITKTHYKGEPTSKMRKLRKLKKQKSECSRQLILERMYNY